jgi:WD40 repeat protein/NAD-dependent SIR2 family protein deacetylase
VADAEFPPNDTENSRCSASILERTSLHGGPVTFATIRFPPPVSSHDDVVTSSDGRRRRRPRDDVLDEREYRDLLASRGRVIFARGPWIESHPLFRGSHANDEGDEGSSAAEEEDEDEEEAGGRRIPSYDPRCYKILAYGHGSNIVDGGSSTIECVGGMIFPSSAPSLAYLKSSPSSSPDDGINETSTPHGKKRRSSGWSSLSSQISAVVFGGRRISFLSGGGLWDTSRSGAAIAAASADNFRSISIRTMNGERKMTTRPYLEVSDWIHDIRMLDIDPSARSFETARQANDGVDSKEAERTQLATMEFLMAMAMASNCCEIWAFRSTFAERGRDVALTSTRLLCIACDVRCMTYSLSLYGWDNDVKLDINACATNDNEISRTHGSVGVPALLAVSGTVFGDIIVWGVVDVHGKSCPRFNERFLSVVNWWLFDSITEKSEDERRCIPTRIRVSPLHRLKGHLGSVFKVKFSECGNFLASSSDDRTVRLWMLTATNHQSANTDEYVETSHCTRQRSATEILALDSSCMLYTLTWTGWGHTARVWDVSFASVRSHHERDVLFPMLVSAGEDGTARVWSPLSSTKEIAHPLRGHRCESIWTVDVCEGVVVTGGNDGCVKLFGLESRVRSEGESIRSIFVPRDPLPTMPVIVNNEVNETGPRPMKTDETDDRARKDSQRKKKNKNKQHESGQAICGMVFYTSSGSPQTDLLIATRAGGLFSLDMTSNTWSDHGSWSEHVMSSLNDEGRITIDPSTGSCVAAHSNGRCAIVGTTEGWLVISSVCGCSQTHPSNQNNTNVAFRAPSYRPVQSVTFIDDSSLLVFYARGAIIWFTFNQSPAPRYVMNLGTASIPLTFANKGNDMYIGDSRGNIAYFSLNETTDNDTQAGDVFAEKPNVLLKNVHGKEHVTGLVITSTGLVVSVGNDGCLHQFKKIANGHLQKLLSIPVPKVTGLRHIWAVADPSGIERIILGGYYGNDFVMLDSTNGYYELLRIATGGRQRRQDLFYNCNISMESSRWTHTFGMAVLTGQKDGINSIDIHCSQLLQSPMKSTDVCHQIRDAIYSIGPSIHGETINDACWIDDGCGNTYLLTGSNDCSVTLSKLKNNRLDSTVVLKPHESCVRGVCSSGRLLVACGGKLSMEFYTLCTSSMMSVNAGDLSPGFVSFLCSYRTLGKPTIDHRMNSVRATSLFPPEKQCHLVLAGDSDGDLHLCVIPERAVARRTVVGKKLSGNGRPILCLALLRCNPSNIFAFVGTTGGEISVWVLPGIILSDGNETHDLDGIIPIAPVHSFKAHETGINDISVANADPRSTDKLAVIITSVGDDQALSTCMLEFTNTGSNEGNLEVSSEIVICTTCASASALKAVKVISDSYFHRIYTVHSSEITLWHLVNNHHELSVNYITSCPTGTEGSCIDCICQKKTDGTVHDTIACGGEGIALLSLNANILCAARKLYNANYLLITAGAGFSADSGLQTYECAPDNYREMCNAAKLIESSYDFQRFWLNFTREYSETEPHIGYDLLDQWCHGGRLRHLNRSSSDIDILLEPWWVYTSNVDGHFRRFKSFSNTSCEIHGSALLFRCACGIGYASGEPRLGRDWDRWNEKRISTDFCKQTMVEMSQNLSSEETILCCQCQRPMRPNVLMFHDTDENVLNSIYVQRERYQTWESLVEERVAGDGQKLVILELGCGVNVTAVREESVDVLLDCTKKVKTNGNEGSVCLIRINPKDAEIDIDDNSFESIPIASSAAVALQAIDSWITVFSRCSTK